MDTPRRLSRSRLLLIAMTDRVVKASRSFELNADTDPDRALRDLAMDLRTLSQEADEASQVSEEALEERALRIVGSKGGR